MVLAGAKLLINNDRTQVYLVEVKYLKGNDPERVKEYARKIVGKWDHSHLFLSTPQGFYYDPCHRIVNNDGIIHELDTHIVPAEIQSKYLSLLKHFEVDDEYEEIGIR